jgi:hypothetical protein
MQEEEKQGPLGVDISDIKRCVLKKKTPKQNMPPLSFAVLSA